MTDGDIVLSRQRSERTGIIIKTEAGAFATWFTVLWSGGEITVCEPRELRLVREERRLSTAKGRVENPGD